MEACPGRGKRKVLGRERQEWKEAKAAITSGSGGVNAQLTMHFLPPLPASITPTQWGQQDWDEEGGSEARNSDVICCRPRV